MTQRNLIARFATIESIARAGGGRGESPSEESHSAVEVPAIVRGSRVLAEEAVRCQLRRDVAVRCKRI